MAIDPRLHAGWTESQLSTSSAHIWDGPGDTALVAEERAESYGARIFLVDGDSKISLGHPGADYVARGTLIRASQIVYKKYEQDPCDCWICSGAKIYTGEYAANQINDWYGEEITGIFYETGKKPEFVYD